MKDPSSKLTRIRLDLEEFDFEIEYIKGKNNVAADALSRINIQELKDLNTNVTQILAVTRSKTRIAQSNNNINNNKLTNNNATKPISHPKVYETFDHAEILKLPLLQFKISPALGEAVTISTSIKFKRKMRSQNKITLPISNNSIALERILFQLQNMADDCGIARA